MFIFMRVFFLGCLIAVSEANAAEDVAARNAAAYIYGLTQANVATISKCIEVDKGYQELYAETFDFYLGEMTATLNRIDHVLREEGTRSGRGAAYFIKDLPTINERAKMEIERQRAADASKFLANCRALPEAAKRHVASFAPLDIQAPEQMREIAEWR